MPMLPPKVAHEIIKAGRVAHLRLAAIGLIVVVVNGHENKTDGHTV